MGMVELKPAPPASQLHESLDHGRVAEHGVEVGKTVG